MKKSASARASLGGMAGRRRRQAAARKKGKTVADVMLRPSEVELLRQLWETGLWSYEALADKFDVPASIAKGIAHFKIHG